MKTILLASSINSLFVLDIFILAIYLAFAIATMIRNGITKSKERPIVTQCPRCKSIHIEYITEYHKCIALRIIGGLTVIVAACAMLGGLDTSSVTDLFESLAIGAIIVVVVYAIIKLFIFLSESRTHIQGICRSCGHIWLIN